MNIHNSITQSRRYYWRYYRLVTFAVILLMAVLTGSLLLGDSVRGTLVQRVEERLGRTETILTSGTGFMDEDILQQASLQDAQGYLLMEGFLSVNDKFIPVYVWGIDNDSLATGEALVNEPLQKKLGASEDLILHLPSHGMVPSGSLFVTQSYATQMRLHIRGCKTVEQGGNILLKNEQTLPLNVFVCRQELSEVMDLKGKMNVVLSASRITDEQVAECWNPVHSGIHLNDTSLTYEGIFIPKEVVDTLRSHHASLHPQLYFAYLVNYLISDKSSGASQTPVPSPSQGLRTVTDTVPYSFVTAVDEWQGTPLKGNDMILSDYVAERLHATVGDSIRMSYYLAKDLKNLESCEQCFCVSRIVPLKLFQNDSLLIADFPGLSNVEKCADWDSDLPIKMEHIHKVDEDFWYQYHQTPKALVAYDAVHDDWSNAFGSATALRFTSSQHDVSAMLSHKPFLTVISPRADGLFSASNGTDFAGLFLALGFFIIVSAILLMQNPIYEMFIQRRDELLLYQQLGYTQKRIMQQLFREAFGTMLMASPIGVLAGVLYAGITLWLLGNVWSGATHTEGFALHVQVLTIVIGWLAGLLICCLSLWYLLRRTLRDSQTQVRAKKVRRPSFTPFIATLAITLGLVAYNFISLHSMVLFIVCGMLWIICFALGLQAWLMRKAEVRTTGLWSRTQLIWQVVYVARRQHLLAYWALSMGVFTVFAVGLNRPDFSDAELFAQATGGYPVYVESRVPIQYDLNNSDVRRKLLLNELPDSTRFLSFLRHSQDEASCLNLNRVATPTVLGVDLDEMTSFGLLPDTTVSAVPRVYIDQESLIWSMMKSVGDTIYYDTQLGTHTPVVIAGSYPTGIFHGNALMSASDFRTLWPRETGVEVLLLQSSHPAEASELLATAMGEYGLSIQTTDERIQMFFEVTDTYLIIFLTLGGMGLLLGVFSLFIIVRKNLVASQSSISIYRSLGYSEQVIRRLLLRENLIVPFYAIVIGVIGSIISISANVAGAGLPVILLAIMTLAVLCATLYFGIHYLINKHTL